MTLTLARLRDNLDDLSPAQRACLMLFGTVSAVIVFPFMLLFNLAYLIATKLWMTSQPNEVDGEEFDLGPARERRGSVDSAISLPPSYRSRDASPVFDYSMPTSSSSPEIRQLRRAKVYIDGSPRSPTSSTHHPSPSTTVLVTTTTEYDYVVYYSSRTSSPTSSRSASSTFSALRPVRRLFPSLHRRATSDSDPAAMSIISSQSAPSSLGSNSSWSSRSASGTSFHPTHRRTFSQASTQSGATRADGRSVNALSGEVFEQRFVTPFTFRRSSNPVASQPVSPKTRPFSPGLSRCDEARPEYLEGAAEVVCPVSTEKVDHARERDDREGKQKLGGLRGLGRKIRRRVVSRRRHEEVGSHGSGSN
ncbi:uncharacterized protein C8Q71DRAFT_486976 [Rhodofomes roseus]|uniref:Uncharacterized protein n=1 Tax=Rhodofomes roseus TaxID=34475 RepID=A0ABQ8JYE9_9APHY|nr:uncharacterized protein C8Q71DRAFT_486976 [Rhodofomes roseus]KAH9828685.1 hypothetical protein C8Q71DRAFT_486976 [Rhodofomes roseus]